MFSDDFFGTPISNNNNTQPNDDTTDDDEENIDELKLPRRYDEPFQGSDVKFHVENRTLHCHSTILNFHSTIWCELFEESGMKEIEVIGKDVESFNLFLDLMYPFPPQPGYQTQQGYSLLTIGSLSSSEARETDEQTYQYTQWEN